MKNIYTLFLMCAVFLFTSVGVAEAGGHKKRGPGAHAKVAGHAAAGRARHAGGQRAAGRAMRRPQTAVDIDRKPITAKMI
ncbi:MAG: hypothetical protein K2Q01_07110 [Rickettsiales bacterium]|nr:hypothetical protein [Rickettsiales bacterium]